MSKQLTKGATLAFWGPADKTEKLLTDRKVTKVRSQYSADKVFLVEPSKEPKLWKLTQLNPKKGDQKTVRHVTLNTVRYSFTPEPLLFPKQLPPAQVEIRPAEEEPELEQLQKIQIARVQAKALDRLATAFERFVRWCESQPLAKRVE